MKDFIKQNSEKINELEEYIKKRDRNKNDLIMILHKAQSLFGYLPEAVQIYVAEMLDIPVAKVYGVITFYSFFKTEQKGEFVINICLGTACFVRGAEAVLDEFKKELNIELDETTADGKFSLVSIRCIGACGLAPVVSINDKIYGNVTREDVKNILAEYKG